MYECVYCEFILSLLPFNITGYVRLLTMYIHAMYIEQNMFDIYEALYSKYCKKKGNRMYSVPFHTYDITNIVQSSRGSRVETALCIAYTDIRIFKF